MERITAVTVTLTNGTVKTYEGSGHFNHVRTKKPEPGKASSQWPNVEYVNITLVPGSTESDDSTKLGKS